MTPVISSRCRSQFRQGSLAGVERVPMLSRRFQLLLKAGESSGVIGQAGVSRLKRGHVSL